MADADLHTAIRRLREIEDGADERHALYLTIQEELSGLGRHISKLTTELSQHRQLPRRDRSQRTERQLEADLTAKRQERDRRQQRRDKLAEDMRELRTLAENCRAFLERSGATVEALQADIAETPSAPVSTQNVS